MMAERKRAIAWVLATIVLVALVLLGHFHRVGAGSDAAGLQSIGYFALEVPQPVVDVPLMDASGEPVRLGSISPNWTLVFFGFTYCPDVCPTTMSILNLAIAGMERPPTVVMVSVDPARDTPEQVSAYVRGFNRDFLGLTGSPADLRTLADQLGIAYQVMPGESENYLVEHSGTLVVLDPQGRHAGYIRPPFHPETIRRIVERLM